MMIWGNSLVESAELVRGKEILLDEKAM